MIKIKLCGQTRGEDIRYSLDSGADLCGTVLEVPSSPRSINFNDAAPLFDEFREKLVALTADASIDFCKRIAAEFNPVAIQLTANETPETVKEINETLGMQVFKSLHLPVAGEGEGESEKKFLDLIESYGKAGASAFVLDTRVQGMYGGSGKKSDWNLAKKILDRSNAKVFLAGGITPDNAPQAAALNPYGIDLASGIEDRPGIKSKDKINALFKALEAVEA